jgi:hypothetical protein
MFHKLVLLPLSGRTIEPAVLGSIGKQGSVLWTDDCLLPSIEMTSFHLGSMGGAPCVQGNITQKTYRSCQKLKSVSLYLSLSTGHHSLGVLLITSLKGKVWAQL